MLSPQPRRAMVMPLPSDDDVPSTPAEEDIRSHAITIRKDSSSTLDRLSGKAQQMENVRYGSSMSPKSTLYDAQGRSTFHPHTPGLHAHRSSMHHPTLPLGGEEYSAIYESSVPPSPSISEGITDSPGSVSSMSSFRRGDLADVEDLDLEPELETVSECDEESSSLCSLDVGVELDSDSEQASSASTDVESSSTGLGLGLTPNGVRIAGSRVVGGSNGFGTPASDYARRKRSEWCLQNYANRIASRRPRRVRKGRVAEIVEEGGEIGSTVMPKPSSLAGVAPEWTCEISGPPVIPPRSVSPSDTVPAVPSPLSECVLPDGQAQASIEDSIETIKADVENMNLIGSAANARDSSVHSESSRAKTPPASSSRRSPPSSPESSRSTQRRPASPSRLRPCFRRRSSVNSACSTRDSSCDRDSARGRSVRFSPGPPQEIRTHSPVEYDRKSCPVNNKLSPEDVEELRLMKMEMGLLEAKWAALAACKVQSEDENRGDDCGPCSSLSSTPTSKSFGASSACMAGAAGLNASRPGYFDRRSSEDAGAQSDSASSNLIGARMTPAARLRLQKEKERELERQRNQPKFLRGRAALASSPAELDCNAVRARFGNAPPPPLPGCSTAPTQSGNRSSSAPPVNRTPSEERAFAHALTEACSRAARHQSEDPVPLLTHTEPSPPASPHTPRAEESKAGTFPGSAGPEEGLLMASNTASAAVSSSHAGSTPNSSRIDRPSLNKASSFSSSTKRPATMPNSWTPPCSGPSKPSYPSYPCTGYDSPGVAGEFYESGSEYDLLG
ncbi:hypothetical protein IE53DRAFT_205319 [Violaceomyces palustris]|uniref:Uncharacterized protein n=1 Tax=Violaceomyces palustris TaxID=1673888 RepID=A0ACD0NQZ5_9BASI|nr:hypothetical protein IE53DRAFT_205319 [Violaceomyces palustris]